MEYQSFKNRQEWYFRISSEGYSSSSSVYGDNPELPKHVRMHLPKAWMTTYGKGMLPNPLSPYAVSKLAGEKYCQVYSRLYGIETVILRYFNPDVISCASSRARHPEQSRRARGEGSGQAVFGPRQDPNSEACPVKCEAYLYGNSAVIPKFIKLISNNQRPTIYGDGTQSRDFIPEAGFRINSTYVVPMQIGIVVRRTPTEKQIF